LNGPPLVFVASPDLISRADAWLLVGREGGRAEEGPMKRARVHAPDAGAAEAAALRFVRMLHLG